MQLEAEPKPVRNTQIYFSRASEPAAIRQENWKLPPGSLSKSRTTGIRAVLYDLDAQTPPSPQTSRRSTRSK